MTRGRGWSPWRPDEIVWNGQILWGRFNYRRGGEARVYVRQGQRIAKGDLILCRGKPYIVMGVGRSANSDPFVEVIEGKRVADRA